MKQFEFMYFNIEDSFLPFTVKVEAKNKREAIKAFEAKMQKLKIEVECIASINGKIL